nr:MAG TPA: hypothetical protein [Caudoviricetes sp.]
MRMRHPKGESERGYESMQAILHGGYTSKK